jgi:hypothetical protein
MDKDIVTAFETGHPADPDFIDLVIGEKTGEPPRRRSRSFTKEGAGLRRE